MLVPTCIVSTSAEHLASCMLLCEHKHQYRSQDHRAGSVQLIRLPSTRMQQALCRRTSYPQHLAGIRQRTCRHHPYQPAVPRQQLAPLPAVGRTAYSFETSLLVRTLVTRQAIKTVLNYLSETNGELHFFLHNYISDHPLPLGGTVDPDEWLVALASTPLSKVQDPRRSSVATAASHAAATAGEREVSPREVAERILGLRQHIATEVMEELGGMGQANAGVTRRALEKTIGEFKL